MKIDIGGTLQRIMRDKKVKVEIMSMETGIAIASLSRIRSNMVEPKFYTMMRICDYLGVSMDEFVNAGREKRYGNAVKAMAAKQGISIGWIAERLSMSEEEFDSYLGEYISPDNMDKICFLLGVTKEDIERGEKGEDFGGALVELMEKNNTELSTISAMLNVSDPTVSGLRKSRFDMKASVMIKICDFYKLKPSEFVSLARNV